MKVREKINLIIDLLLFVALVFIAGIGFLIKYTLPPGRERILKYGNNQGLYFLGCDRHQWGSFHLLVAIIMLGLLVLHILLHWKTILCLVRKAVSRNWLRRSLWGTLGLLCLFLFLFAFVVAPVREEAGDFLYRNARSTAVKADRGEKHLHMNEDHASLNGRMTLEAAAIRFGITIEEVKRRLGLPAHVPGAETFGRLWKTYGFTMQEARDRLEKVNDL